VTLTFPVETAQPSYACYSYNQEPAKAMLDAAWLRLKSLCAILGLTPLPCAV
jgi:hypothetical protein